MPTATRAPALVPAPSSTRDGLAPYATRAAESRGRLVAEPPSGMRTDFQRDRDRVVHSTAFRKLKYKTQVFVVHEGDDYRTRLSHSIEVAQIARSCARALRLDEDLAECVALAHDLGHTPFGHAGEEALAPAMRPHGGFDHNDHTLRIVTRLEARYAGFDGLNLTWEALEGVAKHNGPVAPPFGRGFAGAQAGWDLEPACHAGPEAQVAALSDDIAYTNHDLDDGLRAGLFPLEDLETVPVTASLLAEVRRRHPGLERPRLIHEVIRRLIGAMVEDLVATSARALADLASADEVRHAGRPLIGFSPSLQAEIGPLRQFLWERMYRHHRVRRMQLKARDVVRDLFAAQMAEPETLPPEVKLAAAREALAGVSEETARARALCDHIAGMTDPYAMQEHRRLCDPYARA